MHVRPAQDHDMPALLDMARAFYEASGYDADGPFDAEHTESMIRMIRQAGILLVAVIGGEAVGMVGLMIGGGLCNPAKKAFEVCWWVDPDARRSRAGVALFRAIEPAVRRAGCVGFTMTSLPSSPPATIDLYRRVGMRHTETTFTKHLPQEER